VDKIYCVGDIGIDFYPARNKSFIGGCSFNIATHLSHLGANVTMVSPIGPDQWTRSIEEKITSSNIQTQFLKRSESNLHLEIFVEQGERSFGEYQDDILRNFNWRKNELEALSSANLIVGPYFEEIRSFVDKVIDKCGDRVILDLHDAVNLNEDDIMLLLNKVNMIHLGTSKFSLKSLEKISKQSNKMISQTRGNEGSVLITPEGVFEAEAAHVPEVVDTTGAGDSYLARFIYGLRQGESVKTLLENSNLFAAQTLRHFGGTPDSEI